VGYLILNNPDTYKM